MKVEITLSTPKELSPSNVADIVKTALLSAGCWITALSADDGATYVRETRHETKKK